MPSAPGVCLGLFVNDTSMQSVPEEKVITLVGHNTGHYKQYTRICIYKCVIFITISEEELFDAVAHMHSDEQHAMSSHELQSALILTVNIFENVLC
jgi:hypothetical protein